MFEITIKEIKKEIVKKREYQVVGKKEDGEDQWGYANNETEEDVAREIYSQKVEELDLKEVIKAVNKINE